MNFSPYQPSPDEDRTSRTPKKTNNNTNKNTASSFQYSSYQAGNGASYAEQGLLGEPSTSSSFNPQANNSQSVRVNKYETTLPIRVDIEAALAYALGPVTGVLLLILERQNDYVRFHAWQSTITFAGLLSLLIVMMFISTFLSWTLFFFVIFLMGWLTYRAYLDGVSLERFELPYTGVIASEWVDTE